MHASPTSNFITSCADMDQVNAMIRSLECMFDEVPPVLLEYPIYRVPEGLRSVTEEAYTPKLISIGPLHHANPKYANMEYKKVKNLKRLLHLPNASLKDYVEMLMGLEAEARNCYAESFSYSKEDFVKMMLLDGCYIVELFMQYRGPEPRIENEFRFNNHRIFNTICCDLILVENQLPFFILENLFTLINGTTGNAFTAVATAFFRRSPPICNHPPENDLLHHDTDAKTLVHLLLHCFSPHQIQRFHTYEYKPIPSASELFQVGITFEASRICDCLLDIQFRDDLLTIPTLVVDYNTESLFRNLIAVEQSYNTSARFGQEECDIVVSNYITLIGCLINTSADVTLLCDKGIILNYLGNTEDVALLFNKLRMGIVTPSNAFQFSHITREVNAYHAPKAAWARHKATLKKDYLSNPWAKISLCAAVFLLLCTGIQTYVALQQMIHF